MSIALSTSVLFIQSVNRAQFLNFTFLLPLLGAASVAVGLRLI